jgi:predicted GIY-YIG superfamily endonuclease
MWYVYVLECADGLFYEGVTEDLEGTVTKHNEGHGSGLTSHRVPVKLVYHEKYPTMAQAHKRQIQFAKWRRAHKLSIAASGAMVLPNASAHEACQRNRM